MLPIFRTLLKGSSQESNVFQVLWEQQSPDLTDVNLASRRRIPGDTGSLLLAYRDRVVRIDQRQPQVVVGRGEECGLVVADKFASRQHMTVRLRRTHFYVVDHSINGTFVTLENGDEVHVLRGEMLLGGGRLLRPEPGEALSGPCLSTHHPAAAATAASAATPAAQTARDEVPLAAVCRPV